jgi:hypothetical protein
MRAEHGNVHMETWPLHPLGKEVGVSQLDREGILDSDSSMYRVLRALARLGASEEGRPFWLLLCVWSRSDTSPGKSRKKASTSRLWTQQAKGFELASVDLLKCRSFQTEQ